MRKKDPKIKISLNLPQSVLEFLDNQARLEIPTLNRTQMFIKVILSYKENSVLFNQTPKTTRIRSVETMPDSIVKISLIGNSEINEVLLIHRAHIPSPSTDFKTSIGLDFYSTGIIKVDKDGELILYKGQIWSISTESKVSQSTRPTYYRGSLCAIIALDLKSMESFEQIPALVNEFRKNKKLKYVPILLVGYRERNYLKRAVSIKEINELTRKYDLYYMEQSANIGKDEKDCFDVMANLLAGSEIYMNKGLVFKPGNIPEIPEVVLFSNDDEVGRQAISHLKRIPAIAKSKRFTIEEDVIRKNISQLAGKYNRLHLLEIAEECKTNVELIESTLKKMIENNEIDVRYFESTKSVVFR
jgi:GTPase SAR1 family protein